MQTDKSPVPNLDLANGLWGLCHGWVELRAIDTRGAVQRSWKIFPDDTVGLRHAVEELNGQANVYFGVCLRSEAGAGTKDKIALIPCVWCDIDFKDIPRNDARDLVQSFPLVPSAIVRTGGGVHCYWFLKEPLTREDAAKVEDINHRIAEYLHGDHAACDAARILRWPGTVNLKYDPPRPCELASCDPARRYCLSDFDFLPAWNRQISASAGAVGQTIPESIPTGQRDATLTSLAGSLRRRGCAQHEIMRMLGIMNERCAEPLPQSDLARIAASMMRYPAAPQPIQQPTQAQSKAREYAIPIIATELAMNPPPPKPAIIQGIMAEGSVLMITGRPKAGKSLLLLDLAIALTRREEWLGHYVIPEARSVMYLSLEDSSARVAARLIQLINGRGIQPVEIPPALTLLCDRSLRVDDPSALDHIRKWLDAHRPDILMVDTLPRSHSGDENDRNAMTRVMDIYDDLRRDLKGLILAHHNRKEAQTGDWADMIDKLRGSSAVAGWIDDILALGKRSHNDTHTACGNQSKDFDGGQWTLLYERPDDQSVRLTWAPADKDKAKDREQKLALALASKPGIPLSLEDIIGMLPGIPKRSIQRSLSDLADAETITITGDRKWRRYTYRPPEAGA